MPSVFEEEKPRLERGSKSHNPFEIYSLSRLYTPGTETTSKAISLFWFIAT